MEWDQYAFLLRQYEAVGWPETWDIKATIALAQHVESAIAGLPWRELPRILGVHCDGTIFLIYTDRKPGTTAEQVIDNISIRLAVPMQSAME